MIFLLRSKSHLRILDRNTVKYMIEEQQQEIDSLKAANQEQQNTIASLKIIDSEKAEFHIQNSAYHLSTYSILLIQIKSS